MSYLFLKFVAVITMLIDHIGSIWFYQIAYNGFNPVILRSIGRIAFPIYAYGIVLGWERTKNKKKYFSRLSLCALLSQIPYTLCFATTADLPYQLSSPFFIEISPITLLSSLLTILIYYFYVLDEKLEKSFYLLLSTALLPAITIVFNNRLITTAYGNNLNVIYTFMIAIGCLFTIDYLKNPEKSLCSKLLLLLSIIFICMTYGLNADYGTNLNGVLLIVFLYLSHKNFPKISLIIIYTLWFIKLYAIDLNQPVYSMMLFIVIPLLLISQTSIQSQKPNKFLQLFFYLFYPIHLLILGLLRFVII